VRGGEAGMRPAPSQPASQRRLGDGSPTAVLERACQRLAAHLTDLERADPTDWDAYISAVIALTAALASTAPGAGGRLLTTGELARLLHVSPKTVLKKRRTGELTPALTLGARGRSAIRWRAQ